VVEEKFQERLDNNDIKVKVYTIDTYRRCDIDSIVAATIFIN
jgi:hypothetical protein